MGQWAPVGKTVGEAAESWSDGDGAGGHDRNGFRATRC
jgi:hypothetical protein